jgi:Periplasmic binding protein
MMSDAIRRWTRGKSMFRKSILAAAIGVTIAGAHARAEMPGVTKIEIKIGATFPFSGPASPLSNTGKGLIAYISSINDRGGINGRKINLITYDDAYSPPKTVEQTRKLIENDEVAFLFGPLGTPGISATIKYVNAKKVPHLFVVSGVTKFTSFAEFPMTTTGLPSYDTEGRIYAKYISQTRPNAKIAILYQNDDLGKDFVNARGYLKEDFDKEGRRFLLRGDRADDRFTRGLAESVRCRGVPGCRYAEICGASHQEGRRDRLEAAVPDQFGVDFSLFNHRPRGAGEGCGHGRGDNAQGPGRQEVGR